MKIENANQLEGMATGVLFLSFFGGVWLVFGLLARGTMDAAKVSLVAAVFLAFMSGSLWVMRQARNLPSVPVNPAVGRAFAWVNAAQWAAGCALWFLLRELRLDAYFLTGLAVIVGLHFLPLARLFHSPANYATGGMLLAWAAVAFTFVPVEHLPSTTAFGAGMILWQAAATSLAVAVALAPRSSLSRQPQGSCAPVP